MRPVNLNTNVVDSGVTKLILRGGVVYKMHVMSAPDPLFNCYCWISLEMKSVFSWFGL